MVTRSSVAATQEGKVAVVYVCLCGASCCRQLAGKNLHCCCVLWMRCDASTWRSRRACEQRALNHRRAARGRVVECGETVSAKRKSGLTAPTQQAKRNVCDRGSCFSTVKSYLQPPRYFVGPPKNTQTLPRPPSPYVSSEGSDRPPWSRCLYGEAAYLGGGGDGAEATGECAPFDRCVLGYEYSWSLTGHSPPARRAAVTLARASRTMASSWRATCCTASQWCAPRRACWMHATLCSFWTQTCGICE